MYVTGWCPFCNGARALLRQKGVAPEEIDVDFDPAVRLEMQQRSGRHTVPQIFIGEYHVGGFDDLLALEHAGELDQLLTAVRPAQGEQGQ